MSVFRIQGQSANLKAGIDWFDSSEYKTPQIIAIPDPQGGQGNEPTSIPSPFARMDLANSAFSYVNNMGDNAGYMYHKIVSDCLDIAEIFFYHKKWGSDIEIIEWDKQKDILELIQSVVSPEHQKLGQTLGMYMQVDENSFNFDLIEKIYLLKYKHKIIGATSPLTLFFSTANDLSNVDISFENGDKAFDNQLCPLHKRSEAFQLWLYGMRAFFTRFAKTFRELDAYMSKEENLLSTTNPTLYNSIKVLNTSSYTTNNYKQSNIFIIKASNGQNGLPLLTYNNALTNVNSDYEIAPTKNIATPRPLVLVNGHSGKNPTTGAKMKYYGGDYDQLYKIPYLDFTPLNQRALPGLTGTIYPYLSIGDFLEPYLIKTIYQINDKYFFNANYDGSNKNTQGFLLPLKKDFFKYFNIDDLKKSVYGESMLRFEIMDSGNVDVFLRIPLVNNNYIELKKTYNVYPNKETQPLPNNDKNFGVIVEHQFGLGLFPCIKFESSEIAHYRILLADRDIKPDTIHNKYSLNYFIQSDIENYIQVKDSKIRGKKTEFSIETKFDILENNFDIIEISINSSISGLAIPLFKESQRTRQFNFAIDFGTTNTHIEYSIGNEPPKPLDIKVDDLQIVKLHLKETTSELTEINATFEQDFIPDIIQNGGRYSFPIRTVLSKTNTTNFKGSVFALADVNIPFTYEKEPEKSHNEFIPNLKWSNEEDNKKQVECYLDNLMLLIRNKVLINGGKLDATKITWFYPASMLKFRHDAYKEIWERLYKKNFSGDLNNLIEMSESIAPFNLYSKTQGVSDNSITIDIGGGTTDVYFFKNEEERHLTSFRFAANTIFGDGYNYTSDTNGFIKRFHDDVINGILGDNNNHTQLTDLVDVLNSIEKNKKSADIIAFYFSLLNNHHLKEKNISISFNEMLRDEKHKDVKIIFILFYTTLLYHIATIMKAKAIPMPRHITFSGTGSKTLNILTTDKKTLEKFTKLIFSKIYKEEYTTPLEIIQNQDNPKEITCKGGIKVQEKQSYEDLDNIKITLLGTDNSTFISRNIDFKYNNIPSTELEKLEKEVVKIIEFTFDLNKTFSFNKYFGASATELDSIKQLCMQDIKKYIDDGLKLKRKEIELYNGDQDIEESLIFYPMVGIINSLVRNINSKSII